MFKKSVKIGLAVSFVALAASAPSFAQTKLTDAATPNPTRYGWMHAGIREAWRQGAFGQGTKIVIVDEFKSEYRTRNLFGKSETKSHGAWVSAIAGAYAVSADKTDLQRDNHKKNKRLGLLQVS